MGIETSELIAICAVVIAVCSFVVSVFQSYINRKHNRLSVKPYLFVETHFLTSGPIKVVLKNRGTGPAFIKSVRIFVDGLEIPTKEEQLYKDAVKKAELQDYSYYFYLLLSNQACNAGEEIDLYVFEKKGLNDEDIECFRVNLERISFTINYESIYQEKFVYRD